MFRGNNSCIDGGFPAYAVNYYYKKDVLERIAYPTNMLVANYTYDDLGRTLTTFRPSSTTYTRFSYRKDGQVKGVQFGNGLIANYTYDSL